MPIAALPRNTVFKADMKCVHGKEQTFEKVLAIVQISEYNNVYGTGRHYMGYLTTMEMSKRWGITSRRIAVLC